MVCDYPSGAAPTSTPTYRYVLGDCVDEPILRLSAGGTLHYYHHNQQFSTIGLTNSSGVVDERYGYTACKEGLTLVLFYVVRRTRAPRSAPTGAAWNFVCNGATVEREGRSR